MTDSSILGSISSRDITELLHFTTNPGLTGIIATEQLLSRSQLSENQYLEHIYRPNSRYRREAPKYWDYINLSVSAINAQFFDICSKGWWRDSEMFWVVLSLRPDVAADSGVLFATGNMGYEGMLPSTGAAAWEGLFADRTYYGFGKYIRRASSLHPRYPTDSQAEVLYPRTLPITAVQRIYVQSDSDAARADSVVGIGQHDIEVVTDPSKFSKARG